MPVISVVLTLVDLVVVEVGSKLKDVRPHNLRDIVDNLEDIVELLCGVGRQAKAEVIKVERRNSLVSTVDRSNAAGGVPWRVEALSAKNTTST